MCWFRVDATKSSPTFHPLKSTIQDSKSIKKRLIVTISESKSVQTVQNSKSLEDIQTWIVSYVAQLLDIPTQQVNITLGFDSYGLDSSAVVSLIGDLEYWLKIDLSPAILFDYPTIESLSQYLFEEVSKK
jgi:acyl carrier protein